MQFLWGVRRIVHGYLLCIGPILSQRLSLYFRILSQFKFLWNKELRFVVSDYGSEGFKMSLGWCRNCSILICYILSDEDFSTLWFFAMGLKVTMVCYFHLHLFSVSTYDMLHVRSLFWFLQRHDSHIKITIKIKGKIPIAENCKGHILVTLYK